jgi:SAM-dependent methyltransferase
MGRNAYCPCCNGNFSTFLLWDTSDPNDENRVCPRCNSQSRHRLILVYLRQESGIFKSSGKMLHFAPEPFLTNQFKRNKNLVYITADLYPVFAAIKVDITDINFSNDSFDFILCLHVLEHIPDDDKAIRELYRVLKVGGWALIQVPIDIKRFKTFEDAEVVTDEDRRRVFGQVDHVRICGLDYHERLIKAGFAVDVINYSEILGPKEVQRLGLMSREDFYICKKH